MLAIGTTTTTTYYYYYTITITAATTIIITTTTTTTTTITTITTTTTTITTAAAAAAAVAALSIRRCDVLWNPRPPSYIYWDAKIHFKMADSSSRIFQLVWITVIITLWIVKRNAPFCNLLRLLPFR